MDAEIDPELAEAYEDGRTQGRAEASCGCPRRPDCHLGEQLSWWRRWLDAVTS